MADPRRRLRIKLAIVAVLALVAAAGETGWGRRVFDPAGYWSAELDRREWALARARADLVALRAALAEASPEESRLLATDIAAAQAAVEQRRRAVAEARAQLRR